MSLERRHSGGSTGHQSRSTEVTDSFSSASQNSSQDNSRTYKDQIGRYVASAEILTPLLDLARHQRSPRGVRPCRPQSALITLDRCLDPPLTPVPPRGDSPKSPSDRPKGVRCALARLTGSFHRETRPMVSFSFENFNLLQITKRKKNTESEEKAPNVSNERSNSLEFKNRTSSVKRTNVNTTSKY